MRVFLDRLKGKSVVYSTHTNPNNNWNNNGMVIRQNYFSSNDGKEAFCSTANPSHPAYIACIQYFFNLIYIYIGFSNI